MSDGFMIVSNIVIPVITGIFFFIYFVYFSILFHSKAPSFIYFVAFLLSFSLFLLGRPVQLLSGRHSVPLIIVNIRMVIFCTVTITSIIAASGYFGNRHIAGRRTWIFPIGALFAAVYVIFNTLGTDGSYPVFSWGEMVAFDAYTPGGNPPFYGREVTIALQVIIGVSLTVNVLYQMVVGMNGKRWNVYVRDKVFLFNSGVLLFAITFVIGSLTKQWWLYYFASPFSVLLFGAGVTVDLRELQHNYERLIPTIKENIIENVAFNRSSRKELTELLGALGKTENLDTFAVMNMENPALAAGYRPNAMDAVTNMCRPTLDTVVGRRNYLLIRLNERKIGVLLSLKQYSGQAGLNELELFERLQRALLRSSGVRITIGIGRTYSDISELYTTFQEAHHALEYAAVSEGTVVHVDDIRDRVGGGPTFPFAEKSRLLEAIKLGNRKNCQVALDEFLNAFGRYAQSRPDSLKIRLYEIVGSLIDTAIAAGGDEEGLDSLVRDRLKDIEYIKSFHAATAWLGEIVPLVVTFVSRIHKTRSSRLVDKAKAMIESRYATSISYRDVAKELFISSSHFLSLFKRETNSTFVEYLTRVRIERSKRLLLETNKSITEIAYDVGFGNPNYFSSTFRKLNGFTAKEFRRSSTVVALKTEDLEVSP